jgi:hypothetical protein
MFRGSMVHPPIPLFKGKWRELIFLNITLYLPRMSNFGFNILFVSETVASFSALGE